MVTAEKAQGWTCVGWAARVGGSRWDSQSLSTAPGSSLVSVCQRSILLSLFFRQSNQCFRRSPLALMPRTTPPVEETRGAARDSVTPVSRPFLLPICVWTVPSFQPHPVHLTQYLMSWFSSTRDQNSVGRVPWHIVGSKKRRKGYSGLLCINVMPTRNLWSHELCVLSLGCWCRHPMSPHAVRPSQASSPPWACLLSHGYSLESD